ncbi:MAG: sugar ABC transporter ATP-binding protein [Deltaproteobacteria bacterium]|nr:sugar ABC transporter ATP-binding protein [Deltaproteobacteria bacterium]
MISETPTVELKSISKSFSGVKALENMQLKAFAGSCLGLMGENGAGKSTLMKVLSGIWVKGTYTGDLLVEGQKLEFENPIDASKAGIAIIHQELSLFKELSVAENIFMQRFPSWFGILQSKKLNEKANEILNRLGFKLSPEKKVKDLSIGEQQLVEIARAFVSKVKVLIFDEPTSALSDKEIENLFRLIRDLKAKGVACIYISHKLPEIREICDCVTVIRDGQWVADFETFTDEQIIEAMVGRKIENVFPPKRPFNSARENLLEVRNLNVIDKNLNHKILDDISFDLKKGEILGISGLMGSGRSELLYSLFGGLAHCKTQVDVSLESKPISLKSPRAAIQSGLAFLTEDRKGSGLVLEMDVKSNMTLPILKKVSQALTIQFKKEKEVVDYYQRLLRIKTPSIHFKIRHLSGGNQQKVILGRWLSTAPKILLLDEPTRGIDVSAKAEIYHLIRDLVDQGLTLILVSSELPEIVSLSDRVLVLQEGKKVGLLSGNEISQENIMMRATAA